MTQDNAASDVLSIRVAGQLVTQVRFKKAAAGDRFVSGPMVDSNPCGSATKTDRAYVTQCAQRLVWGESGWQIPGFEKNSLDVPQNNNRLAVFLPRPNRCRYTLADAKTKCAADANCEWIHVHSRGCNADGTAANAPATAKYYRMCEEQKKLMSGDRMACSLVPPATKFTQNIGLQVRVEAQHTGCRC